MRHFLFVAALVVVCCATSYGSELVPVQKATVGAAHQKHEAHHQKAHQKDHHYVCHYCEWHKAHCCHYGLFWRIHMRRCH
jgi:hypothetical protein